MSEPSTPPQCSADELNILFLKACELQENNQQSDALAIYERLVKFIPDSPLLHFNMGLAQYDLLEFSKADSHYRIAARENPEDPDIHFNQGLNYRRLDRIQDAITSFRKAVERGDSSQDTIYNLALCHQDVGELEQASKLYDILLSNNPEHLATLNNYAYLCHKSCDLKKAEKLYKQLLLLNPNHEAAQHMLNSLAGHTSDTAPLSYVETIFDNYAETFEESLLNDLAYQTPTELWKQYDILFHSNRRVNGLDLGCGTGLATEAFLPCCRDFTGVDISDKILKVADSKNIYTKLIKGDILSFLEQDKSSYDLIIAADVFTYMGNLEPLFEACSKQSMINGVMCFSVENTEADAFILKDTGRFGHSLSYIENLCEQTGWTILTAHNSKLRQDRKEWIWGHLFVLQKTNKNN